MTKKEIRQEWVKRLRSGLIPQAKGRLALGDGSRCCLGVLADMAVEEGVIGPPAIFTDGIEYNDCAGTHPSAVTDWAGLTTRDGRFYPSFTLPTTLAFRNDRGLTFSEIADIIESEPEGLFVKETA